MTDYQRMYTKLFNTMTDCIVIMQQVQRETEEMFIAGEEYETNIEPFTIVARTEKDADN